MSGVVAAQFTTAVQTAFKATVANEMGKEADAVEITSYSNLARRESTLLVEFRFYDDTSITPVKVQRMSSFLGSSDTSGFKTKLNEELNNISSGFVVKEVKKTVAAEMIALSSLTQSSLTLTLTGGQARRHRDGCRSRPTEPHGDANRRKHHEMRSKR